MPGAFLILTEEASFRRAVRRKSLISLICLGCIGQRHASNTDGAHGQMHAVSQCSTSEVNAHAKLWLLLHVRANTTRSPSYTCGSLYQRVRAALPATQASSIPLRDTSSCLVFLWFVGLFVSEEGESISSCEHLNWKDFSF